MSCRQCHLSRIPSLASRDNLCMIFDNNRQNYNCDYKSTFTNKKTSKKTHHQSAKKNLNK